MCDRFAGVLRWVSTFSHGRFSLERECKGYQHFSLDQKLPFGASSSFFSFIREVSCGLLTFDNAAVLRGCCEPGCCPPAACLLASTTRRTSTSVNCQFLYEPLKFNGQLTSKCLLNINHLPRTRLHESAPPFPRPLQPILGFNDPLPL